MVAAAGSNSSKTVSIFLGFSDEGLGYARAWMKALERRWRWCIKHGCMLDADIEALDNLDAIFRVYYFGHSILHLDFFPQAGGLLWLLVPLSPCPIFLSSHQ